MLFSALFGNKTNQSLLPVSAPGPSKLDGVLGMGPAQPAATGGVLGGMTRTAPRASAKTMPAFGAAPAAPTTKPARGVLGY